VAKRGSAERKVAGGLALVAALAAWTLAPAPVARAETVLLYRDLAQLGPGLRLSYFTDQRRLMVATYTAEVDVLEVQRAAEGSPETVRFRWRIFDSPQRPNMDDRGMVTTTGLRRGRAMNAWWSPGQEVTTRDTHVWLSVEACEELHAREETQFAIDVNLRRDTALRLRRVRSVEVPVELNGRQVVLRGMELRSSREDRLVMLDNCEHPLVLEADIPGISLMRIRSIRTGVPVDDDRMSP